MLFILDRAAIAATHATEGSLATALDAASSSPLPENVSYAIVPGTSREQAYYWTRAWQEGELESLAELQAGRVIVFEEPGAAVRWLLQTDD